MTLNDYQEASQKFRQDSYDTYAAAYGLFSEAGEVAGVLQKHVRGDFDTRTRIVKIKKELGDVLWHIVAVAEDHGLSLQEIAEENIVKLQDRLDRNVIKGSGDDR